MDVRELIAILETDQELTGAYLITEDGVSLEIVILPKAEYDRLVALAGNL